MAYAWEIFFDVRADMAVRELWEKLERVGVPTLRTASHGRHHPHVTLAVSDHFEVGGELIGALNVLPGTKLNFPLVGVFPGDAAVLFLGVRVTAALLEAHADIHAAIAGEGGGDGELGELYKPGSWVPHCTLAMRLGAEDLARACRVIHPFAGLQARIAKVGLVNIETGDVEDVVGGRGEVPGHALG